MGQHFRHARRGSQHFRRPEWLEVLYAVHDTEDVWNLFAYGSEAIPTPDLRRVAPIAVACAIGVGTIVMSAGSMSTNAPAMAMDETAVPRGVSLVASRSAVATPVPIVDVSAPAAPAPAPPAPASPAAPAPTHATAPAPAPKSTPAPAVKTGGGWDVWARLANCESGYDPNNASAVAVSQSRNSGNGFYGSFQFTAATWKSIGGPGLAYKQSYEVQKEFAIKLQARSGWSQWPACSSKLGLR